MMPSAFVTLQYLYPKQLLTSLAGHFARAELGGATTSAIAWFAKRYGVNMAEAANPDVASYRSFNDFFTRPLRAGARPIADAELVCPVDGAISVCGALNGDRLVQAKQHSYTTSALLGGDEATAKRFQGGSFATIYLSPRDYHRIHMPCDGRLVQMTHVPGDLFSVNPATVDGVPGLFARNERVVCVFEGKRGPFAMVLVGATIVGSMATVWHGVVNPPRPGVVRTWEYADGSIQLAKGAEMGRFLLGWRVVRTWEYADGSIPLAKGAEMGRFLLGSTVVMLFPAPGVTFQKEWAPAWPVRMGAPMGAF